MDVEEIAADLEAVVRQADVETPAAEVHGMLTGLLCAQSGLGRDAWLQMLKREVEGGAALAEQGGDLLAALYEETVRQLSSSDLDFEPLLADEEAELDERVHALGRWCQGYLWGLGLGGVGSDSELPADTREALNDLAEVSRAGDYAVEEGEADEAALTELVEFLRTVVLMVQEELNPTKAPPRQDETLH